MTVCSTSPARNGETGDRFYPNRIILQIAASQVDLGAGTATYPLWVIQRRSRTTRSTSEVQTQSNWHTNPPLTSR